VFVDELDYIQHNRGSKYEQQGIIRIIMKLPHAENAVVPESKITQYLLNAEHPRGKDKAEFFTRFGFSMAQWESLRDALLAHAIDHDVASTLDAPEGILYAIEGVLDTPDKRLPQIRSVWMIDTDSTKPRFVTAYPLR
jgi:hypothetical protein